MFAESGNQSQEWVWRNPLPQANDLRGVTASTNRFVAVGSLGVILVSGDGTHWVHSSSPTRNLLSSVVYGDGLLVAVGENGTILRSGDDGETWTTPASGTSNFLSSVTYGNNRFVAVGANGTILLSFDGISWAEHSLGTNQFLRDAIYGNGLYLALGSNGAIVTSTDGEHWLITGPWGTLYAAAYGNGRFVVLGYNTNVLLSDDGHKWTAHSATNWEYAAASYALLYTGDGFVSIISGQVYKSEDGIVWTATAPNQLVQGSQIAWMNGVYVTVSYEGQISWATNLADWTSSQTGVTPRYTDLWEAFFGGDKFFAIGAEYSAGIGNFLLLISNDGIQWVTNSPGPFRTFGRNSLAYGRETLVAIADHRYSYTSSDGTNWSQHLTGTDFREHFNGIAFARDTFVIAGGDRGFSPGFILTSTNGADWTRREVPLDGNGLLSVSYGNNTYVVVGQGGRVLTSTDSVSWSDQMSGTDATLDRVVFGNGRFVATGLTPLLFYSSDASNWVAVAGLPLTGPIAFGAGTFLAAAERGRFLTSIDGARWNERSGIASPNLFGLTFGKDTFVAVGAVGTILQSTPNWQPSMDLRWDASEPNPELTIAGLGGRAYRVEYCSTLGEQSNWQQLTNLHLQTSFQTWTDVSATRTNSRHYRVTMAQ
jgi:photosystem II stability/assembly factor-like uncharacterized protein